MNWAFLASNGASIGVLVMWDKRGVKKMEELIRKYIVAYSFRSVEDSFMCIFAGIYGSDVDNNKHLYGKN